MSVAVPTAVQADSAVQETAFRTRGASPAALCGLGTCSIDHREPFQSSASADSALTSVSNPPTAMQVVLDGQDTPFSALVAAGLGFAEGSIDQFKWSERSDSVVCPVRKPVEPTAVHVARGGHAMPFSTLPPARVRAGVASVDHVEPFHRSTSVIPLPAAFA